MARFLTPRENRSKTFWNYYTCVFSSAQRPFGQSIRRRARGEKRNKANRALARYSSLCALCVSPFRVSRLCADEKQTSARRNRFRGFFVLILFAIHCVPLQANEVNADCLTPRSRPLSSEMLKQLALIGIKATCRTPFPPPRSLPPSEKWIALFLSDFEQKGPLFQKWLEMAAQTERSAIFE